MLFCMGSQLLSIEAIAGIQAKLERADQSIQNLNSEITAFINDRPNRAVPGDKRQAAEEWWQDRLKKTIPPRFSVVTGEIIHHFRSALDHVAWDLSADTYRRSNERDIGFPIFTEVPKKNNVSSYDRKVAGIQSLAALDILKKLQPYNTPDPTDTSLAIINSLDRVYKHRNLVLVVGSFRVDITFPLQPPLVIRAFEPKRETESIVPAGEARFDITFFVAFREFGKKQDQSVIPSLTQLKDEIRRVVAEFA
jgi:hypothetical protein